MLVYDVMMYVARLTTRNAVINKIVVKKKTKMIAFRIWISNVMSYSAVQSTF